MDDLLHLCRPEPPSLLPTAAHRLFRSILNVYQLAHCYKNSSDPLLLPDGACPPVGPVSSHSLARAHRPALVLQAKNSVFDRPLASVHLC